MDHDRRPPAVAGTFYPAEPASLAAEVAGLLGDTSGARPHLGLLVPHAGYVYSGRVAGQVFAATVVPRRVIVLAPNHTGRGARAAVWGRGRFLLPGEALPVDEELCAALIGRAGMVDDREAHLREHALEVVLPFLRAREPGVRITPIVLGPLDHAACAEVARAIAAATADLPREELLVVASSDLNHYLDDDSARRLDRRVLEPVLGLDARGLHERVLAEDHSMCGVIPATVMLEYARARGATRADLIAYATSGDAFGERDRVVGYAGVTVD
ncbi:MAG: AmmeMemoRadiSam system protein B [Myxococcales bacterium]|nr:AmmeMemoRadiSam system protein B [Myxococcales bacterium]